MESEILNASMLDKSSLLNEIDRAKNLDFSMIVFAGHGCTIKTELPWSELHLFLASEETVSERELNPGTPRFCLVLDCCRTRGENVEGIMEHRKEASLEDAYAAFLARPAYEKVLNQAEMGAVTIYSTGDNTSAEDKKSFSQYLIRGARIWVERHQGVLTINEAVQIGAAGLQKTHPQQHPEYHGGRRRHHFPFAVSV